MMSNLMSLPKKIWNLSQTSSCSPLSNRFPNKTEEVKIYPGPRPVPFPTKGRLAGISTEDYREDFSQNYSREPRAQALERYYGRRSANKTVDEISEVNRSSMYLSNEGKRLTQEQGKLESSELFGSLSMNMSESWTHNNHIFFKDIDYESKLP